MYLTSEQNDHLKYISHKQSQELHLSSKILLRNGNPINAIEPIKNIAYVNGRTRTSPPIRRISCSSATA